MKTSQETVKKAASWKCMLYLSNIWQCKGCYSVSSHLHCIQMICFFVTCSNYTVHKMNISASTCIPSQTATFLLDHHAVQQYVNNIYIPLLTNKSIRGKRSWTNSANVLMDLKDPTSSWKHVTSPFTVPRDFITFLTCSPASTFRHPWTKKLHTICSYNKSVNYAHICSSLTLETMFRLLSYDKQHPGSP